MAPKSSFDKEMLFVILRDHPDWSRWGIAQELTLHNYAMGLNVKVNVSTVYNAIHKFRDELESQGIHTAKNAECPLITELKRVTGQRTLTTEVHQNSLELRRLRQIWRMRAGLALYDEAEVSKARSWEEQRKMLRQVVDISDDGVPYLRPAAHWELDEDGQLIDLIARRKPRGMLG
jgi:hypothetical protein